MTTTTAVKINRAEVMKNAWQLFREKAVRTMKAWSEALRSAWKKAKGGDVVENAPSAQQINYYRDLILKQIAEPLSKVAHNRKFRPQYRSEAARELLIVAFVALDLIKTVDSKNMRELIDTAKRYDGIIYCAAMSGTDPEKEIAWWTDERYDQFFNLAVSDGAVRVNTIWKTYLQMRGDVQNV